MWARSEPARNPARKSQHIIARCSRNKYRSQLGTRWNPLRNPPPEQQALGKINISPSIRSSNYNIIKRPDGLLQLPLPLAPPFLLEFYGWGGGGQPPSETRRGRRQRGSVNNTCPVPKPSCCDSEHRLPTCAAWRWESTASQILSNSFP